MVKILTHNGRFHTDEVFAIAMLKIFFNNEIEVTRTRDLSKINDVDFVLDIGREYNPSLKRFDHHQDTFFEKRDNKIPYATAGLIWKHYGEQVTSSPEVVKRLDLLLIQAIDAEDNGVNSVDKNSIFTPYQLHNVIQSFRKPYDIRNAQTDLQDFLIAVEFAENLLKREILKIEANVKGESEVTEILNSSNEQQFIILEKQLPWEEVIINYPDILFMIQFNDENDNWSIYSIRKDKNSFEPKKPFPKKWAGKEGELLAKITGIKDAVFCHKGLFLTVAKTKQGAIDLTNLAIES